MNLFVRQACGHCPEWSNQVERLAPRSFAVSWLKAIVQTLRSGMLLRVSHPGAKQREAVSISTLLMVTSPGASYLRPSSSERCSAHQDYVWILRKTLITSSNQFRLSLPGERVFVVRLRVSRKCCYNSPQVVAADHHLCKYVPTCDRL